MSIQVLRDGQIERRRNEKQASLRRRSSRLRALNAVTAALTHHVGLPSALYTDFDAIPPPPLTPEEAILLDKNDLNKGRYFQETSFPFSLDTVKNALATAFPAVVADEHVSPQPIASDPRSTIAQTPFPTVAEIEPQSQRAEVNDDAELATSARGEGVGNTREGRALQPTQAEARHDEKDRLRVSQEAPSSPSTAAITTGATPIRTETSPDTSVEGQGAARAPSPAPVDADPTPASEPTTTSPKASKQDLDGDVTIPDASTVSPADKPSPAPIALAQPTQQQLPIQADATPRPTKFNEIASESTLEQQAPSIPATKPQRMQTRVSSGAMRQKSVSEIIQESPRTTPRRKPPPLNQEPSSLELAISRPPSSSRPHSQSMPAPPLPTRQSLTLTSDHVDADLSLPLDDDAYASLRGASDDSSRDYLEPLYRIQAQEPPNARGLGELLHRASKSINTGDQFIAYRERQDQRLLKRVYGLQYSNHWSLRQMQPCAEPPAPTTHWDHVLSEMKWMRTDFRQERKEKKVLAKYFAEQCADWVGAEPAMRFEMQVRTKVPESARSEEFHDAPQSPAATSLENGDAKAPQDDNVPDLESSSKEAQSPSSSQDMPPTPQYAAVPDAFFTAAGMSELTSHMLESDEFMKAIQELPLFTPFDHEAVQDQRAASPANGWPPSVSKYITGKVLAKTSPAPKKHSRFDYEDEYPEDERESKRQRASEGDGLAPEQIDVALFDSEYKSIKDRLHATNIFRPPSEFNMPSEKFYEWRLASQWTHDDDQKLKKLAKEYTFNWSLIADQMRLPSHFHGAADRRTPWECFERWVELETLPLELRKTNYFRAWVSRLESAARLVDAKYQAQLQLHSQNPNPTQPPMKRRTMPVRVERRRTGRYLHIIDAMRKLARKREQQAHKQHEAQKAANMRKNHTEPAQPKTNIHTPQEFSKLRHERDLQLAARQERMREAMLAQQKAAQMQRAGQHSNPQAAMAAQQPRQGNVQMAQGQNGQIPNIQSQVNMPGQPRQINGVQGMPMQTPGGHLAVPNMGMQNGVPQAQMQPNMRSPGAGPNQMSQEAINRMSMQNQMKNATQMSAQQMKQYQQQQMLSPGGNQAMNVMMQNGQVPNNQSAMLAAMQQQQQGNQSNMNNMQTHSAQQMNGSHTSMSPHMPPPNLSQPKQLSSGHVPAINQIKHRIQIANPGASPQQIDQMANEEMKQRLARQSATNAATGNYGNVNKQNMNAYDQNSQAFMQNNPGNGQNLNGQVNNFSNMAQGNMAQGNNQNQASPSQAQQQQYSHMMRQQLMAQRQQLSSSGMNNNGSPRLQSVGPANTQSPVNMHVSPVMQGAMPNMSGVNMNGMNGMNMGQMNGMNGMSGGNNQQRPPSRNATPGMVRIPSSNGMVSPGLPHQGSPRAQMVKQ